MISLKNPAHSLPTMPTDQALDRVWLDCYSTWWTSSKPKNPRLLTVSPRGSIQPCSLPITHINPWTCLILPQLDCWAQQHTLQYPVPRLKMLQSLARGAPRPLASHSTYLSSTQSAGPNHSLINYCLWRPWSNPHCSLTTEWQRTIGRDKTL